MANWFSDKEHLENAAEKVFLKEIFKVAKAEERYVVWCSSIRGIHELD
jgi:succinate dehydrogenase flavin-adding protein (antitoxin of CptAB toxin-antitoxin module)